MSLLDSTGAILELSVVYGLRDHTPGGQAHRDWNAWAHLGLIELKIFTSTFNLKKSHYDNIPRLRFTQAESEFPTSVRTRTFRFGDR